MLDPGTIDLDPNTAGIQTTFTVPGQGTFTVNPTTGVVTFTPVSNFNGPVTPITYQVCDNGTPLPALCDDATITVTVTPVNDPPVANNDVATTPEDTPVTINILANDSDVDGSLVPGTIDLDPNTAGIQTTFTVPGQGTFTVNPTTGIVTFTPVLNFNGVTTPVTYQVCDNGTPLPAQCDDATITVTVTPVNDAPVAVNDVATTIEDTPVTINILSNDSDVDGMLDPATIDLDPNTSGIQTTFTVPGQGTFTVNPTTGVVTFTPVPNFNGTTTPITYVVCDNGTPLPALCDDATIVVTVNPVNDPPTITQPPVTTPEDTPITFCPTLGDPDVGDVLTISVCNSPANGTAVVAPGNCITFTPAPNFNGVTTVCVQVCDQNNACTTTNVPVTVTPVNDPPVAVNDVATTPEDTPVTINILSNDSDIDGSLDPATIDLDPNTSGIQTTFTVPGQGTFTVNTTTGVVTFTPVSNFNGPVTPITYQVCDNGTPLPSLCASATITVTVTPVNDPPVAVNDVATTPEDTPVTINILANDSDVDGTLVPGTIDLDPNTAGIQTTFTVPGQGTLTVNPTTGIVTFTPVLNFNGVTTPVTYQVCDNGTPLPSQCATATITVTVTPVNDPPAANDDTATTLEDTPVNISILANDTDVDGMIDPATVDLNPGLPGFQTTFTVPGEGTYTYNPATGVLTFTPVANFNGPTTPLVYSVCDNGTPLPSLCDFAFVNITVTPVNDPPVANNDAVTTPEDTPVTFNPLTNDTDLDGSIDPNTLDLDPNTSGIQTTFTVPGQGTFVANPVTGAVTFTPASNFSGVVTIPYVVCDTGTPLPSQCDDAVITVTVVFDPNAKLSVKVLLQGAMIGVSDGLMRDDLRSGGYIPLTEPYTALSNSRFTHVGGGGGETTTAAVLAANAGTPNAIVDWVFVELRSATDSASVVRTRSALVQRDGDVVSATDGVSPLVFTGFANQQYFVTVKHRNHLGVMTAAKVQLLNDGTLVDFTTATNAQVYNRPGSINYDGQEMVTVNGGKRGLWAGNVNADNKVKYQGPASDNTGILAQVLSYPTNTTATYNFNNALGYFMGDVNMDGKVKYQGIGNDPQHIFVNVVGLYTTLNTAALYNYDLFIEQMP
jgi:CshA-type fibril repeat protein